MGAAPKQAQGRRFHAPLATGQRDGHGLTDKAPPGVITRLDEDTAEELAGWARIGLTPPTV